MKLVRLDEIAPSPWRNGGGRTRELLAWPQADGWALRISVADIERDGPFSAFAGVDRWFAVIDGEGVALSFADGERQCRRGDAVLHFDGADAPGCRLLDGATRDLNLMVSRGRGAMRRVMHGEPAPAASTLRALYTADALALQAGGQAIDLPAGCLAWHTGSLSDRWTTTAHSEPRAWWISFDDIA
jgi:uncharacterized protein